MLKATPQRLGPWLVAAAAPHKAAELRDPAHGLAQRGWTRQAAWDSDGWHNTSACHSSISNSTSHGISGTARASMVA